MQSETESASSNNILNIASNLVVTYVGHNTVPPTALPELIKSIHDTLRQIAGASEPRAEFKPAVPLKRSVMPDYIVCLEDGKRLTMLKRYLRTRYNLSPEAYRLKWGLPADYPMVAPNYAQLRSKFAKEIGLGRSKSRGKRRAR